MKASELFEQDRSSLVKTMTQGIKHLKLDPKEVEVTPKKHSSSQRKQCFNNSFKALSGDHSELYVLGFMFYHGIPIEHAWIKKGDKYFDVTLDMKDVDCYVSVLELSFSDVMEYVDKHHSAPSLYDFNRFKGTS